MPRCHECELADLRAQLVEARKERDHWKANHDRAVEIKRAVLDRPDLGDRAKSVLQLVADCRTLAGEVRSCRNKLISTGGGLMVGGSLEDTLNLHNARAATDASGALARWDALAEFRKGPSTR